MATVCPCSVPMTPLFTLPLTLGAMPKPTSIDQGDPPELCARASDAHSTAMIAVDKTTSRRQPRIKTLLGRWSVLSFSPRAADRGDQIVGRRVLRKEPERAGGECLILDRLVQHP